MHEPIKVDIWSDVACPWCYLGKRRFEAGLAAFAADPGRPEVEVEYHSYELNPEIPEDFEGSAAKMLAELKGVPEAQARQAQDQIAAVAAEAGLAYDFTSQQPTRTLRAHQVLHLAKAYGVQTEVKERLLSAHFVEGRHVGRDEELAALAAEAGVDREEVLRALREERYLPDVEADVRRARELGIGGVPFYVLDGRYAVSGAQPPELFTRALEQVWEERRAGSAA